jgi:transposase InsO family protein
MIAFIDDYRANHGIESNCKVLQVALSTLQSASLKGYQVSNFTYVSAWAGFAYMAFVIDNFANRIFSWKMSLSMTTDFVLEALEPALYAHRSS